MSSNSHSQGAKHMARAKSKAVTTQHTLERVRNNQRRHRARRKDYIATLEEKLSLSEHSVTRLQNQVDVLQAELAQSRAQAGQTAPGCAVLPDQFRSDGGGKLPSALPSSPSSHQFIEVQTFGPVPDATDLDFSALASPLHGQLQHSDDLSTVEFDLELISPQARPDYLYELADLQILRPLVSRPPSPYHASETLSTVLPLSNDVSGNHHSTLYRTPDLPLRTTDQQSRAELIPPFYTSLIPDARITTTRACCSEGRAMVPPREYSLSRPGYVISSAMDLYGRYVCDEESTVPCTEAYALIAQQNVKGISQIDIVTWLWQGFRNSARRGEGCQVRTEMLISLLAFVSEI